MRQNTVFSTKTTKKINTKKFLGRGSPPPRRLDSLHAEILSTLLVNSDTNWHAIQFNIRLMEIDKMQYHNNTRKI